MIDKENQLFTVGLPFLSGLGAGSTDTYSFYIQLNELVI